MQIQNVEALKSWLTARLEPICDADPAALAKYVVALVKKDKTQEELKHVCKDQLEVFLSDETNKFVEVLFESLDNQSYLPPAIVEPLQSKTALSPKEKQRKPSLSEDFTPNKALVESSVPDDDDRDFRRTRKITDSSSKEQVNSTQDVADKARKRPAEDEPIGQTGTKIAKEDHGSPFSRKQDMDDSEGRKNGEPQPIPSTHTSRDGNRDRRYPNRRDRDFNVRGEDEERFRRSGGWSHRGRGRDGDRSGRPRDYRERHDGNQRFGHRERGKVRCRDYEEKGFCIRGELCLFDHGNDPVVIQDMPMQGMIPGFPPPAPFIPGGPPLSGIQVPPPILPVPPESFPRPPNQQPSSAAHPKSSDGTDANKSSEGPDHSKGPAPNIVSVPRLPVSSMQQPMVRPQPPVMVMPPMDAIRPPFMQIPVPRPNFPPPEDSYNPEQPQFERLPVWMRIGTPRAPMPLGAAPLNPAIGLRSRELLTVPSSQSQLTVQVVTDKPSGESNRKVIGPDLMTQEQIKTEQINNNMNNKPAWRKYNDTLELKKIPRELNNITKLNEHFQKFGNIVNIQVNAFGDSEAALVKFSKHIEAKAAYTCPDAVLGNRFIRVFWHQPDRENKPSSGKGGSAVNAEDNKVQAKPTMFQSGKTTFIRQANNQVAVTTTTSTSTDSTPTTVATSTKETPSATASTDTKPATTVTTPSTTTVATTSVTKPVHTTRNQQRQEIMKKKLDIQKQKQELLDKQIQQQKLLITKIEKKNLSASEKSELMKTLKSLSKNIESIKQEIELAAMSAKSKQSPLQARQLAQKAILDQELDLISHQHSGEDTTELKKKVEELKQEAKSLGLLDFYTKGRGIGSPRGRGTSYSRGRGYGRGRGRGRGSPSSRVWTKESAALEQNSKQICVSDIKQEEKETIIEHFMEFGNVDRVEYEEDKGDLVLTFRTRKEAEIAFKARKLKDRMLVLSWHKLPSTTAPITPSPTAPPPKPRTRSSTLSSSKLDEDLGLDLDGDLDKHEEEHDEDEAALLLGEDFDEEELDEEDRSWRR